MRASATGNINILRFEKIYGLIKILFLYSSNTKTALIARGTKEIQTFALYYGAKSETLFGLAGVGKYNRFFLWNVFQIFLLFKTLFF